MWWKKKGKEEKEKVIAYLRSRLFPWNFVFDDVDEAALEHFVPYAIQICDAKGIEKDTVSADAVKEVITREIREAVDDYLFDPEDTEMTRMHGEFATIYPFAFSQCLAHVILYRLGLTMEEAVDVKGISDLLGQDIQEMKKRENFIRNVISRKRSKAMKIFAKSVLHKKVITAGGDYIGSVGDIIFTDESGQLKELMIHHLRGSGLKKSRVSMDGVRLNMYSKNIVLKPSNYHKKWDDID